MRRNRLKTVSLLCFTASVLTCAALPFANIATSAQAQTDRLVAPISYEQYLPLSEPSDIAICEDYTAIADGNLIYIYDRADNEYRTVYIYDRADNEYRTVPFSSSLITKIQFDENDDLYALDSLMDFYKIDVKSGAVSPVSALQCTAFLIDGDNLFYTTSTGDNSQLFKTQLSNPDKSTAEKLGNLSGSPALAFWENELYFTDESFITHLYKINPDTKQTAEVGEFSNEIDAMAIAGGELACVFKQDSAVNFCTYPLVELSGNTPIDRVEGQFSAVTAFDGLFYTIEGAIVKQYSTKMQGFTDFEICSSSDSKHRFSGATATYLSGETLYIADAGNSRICVYDTQTQTFKNPVVLDMPPSFLSADEKTLLVASNDRVEIIDLYNPTVPAATLHNFHGEIVGAANVYGKYYLATSANYFYAISQNDLGEWTMEQCKKTSTRYPKQLVADAYGMLYVHSGNDIYRFSEETLMQASEAGEEVISALPTDITQIAVDYHQTVYALSANAIHRFVGDASTTTTFETPLVYYANGQTPTVNAFAFGIEENQTYVLCDNSYLLVSERLNLPTVKTIAVGNADEKVFENASAEFAVVQTSVNALLVEFDITLLQNAEVFPYVAYERSVEQKTALKIGQADGYTLLAYFDQAQNAYRTYLTRTEYCSDLPADEYHVEYDEADRKIGYITNALPLYKFPYLTDLLVSFDLPRGGQVTLLGEISELDHAYYHVSFLDENGVEHFGYVPQAYVNDFNGLPPQSELHQTGATESDTDAVWRLAYLLLGFGAICVLIDFLILRKKGGND